MKLTPRQEEAQRIFAGPATHILGEGGSRSGKTALIVRNIVMRALKAPASRHTSIRFRFNHCKESIALDTFPKVMRLAFPEVKYHLDKTDWYVRFPNASEYWFGGLDDKERTDKILGKEFVTIHLNEVSQISKAARDVAVTRLAQQVYQQSINGAPPVLLKPRMYYDQNPPNKAHWTYLMFHLGIDPETREAIGRTGDYAYFRMNPQDNAENITGNYLESLKALSARMRRRFLDGEYADANPNQLFSEDDIEKWRVVDSTDLPDMVRILVAVDPSGSGDVDNADNDEIGIVVAGLGTDGNGYLIEDCTVKAGPGTWGRVTTSAYDRHDADAVVGESNFGGDMVRHTIQTARPRTPYKAVTASRGKAVRAEPIAALYEAGKIRHVGKFQKLEDELCGFSTVGYTGSGSPNRADAAVWAFTELFPGMTKPAQDTKKRRERPVMHAGAWMG